MDWKAISLEVRTRSNLTCVRCGRGSSKENPIQADHVIPLSRGGNSAKVNLRALCKECNNARKRGQTQRAGITKSSAVRLPKLKRPILK